MSSLQREACYVKSDRLLSGLIQFQGEYNRLNGDREPFPDTIDLTGLIDRFDAREPD